MSAVFANVRNESGRVYRTVAGAQAAQAAGRADDGLLTASEVAHLKLNADWVVLSACYTAAAEPRRFLLGPPWCAMRILEKQIRVFVLVP